jgi:hypothetical protein
MFWGAQEKKNKFGAWHRAYGTEPIFRKNDTPGEIQTARCNADRGFINRVRMNDMNR